ncbi:hypothetical protein H5410_022077 [Solanum commersonii]|uniref:Uncharacterized protein n=1 Tax=Solanum commersonii TaxID=4109 RepID=A0A9J5ZH17_SOLCO|nr:hypothetical protein H5410_022077 [Solanum commersonii]
MVSSKEKKYTKLLQENVKNFKHDRVNRDVPDKTNIYKITRTKFKEKEKRSCQDDKQLPLKSFNESRLLGREEDHTIPDSEPTQV